MSNQVHDESSLGGILPSGDQGGSTTNPVAQSYLHYFAQVAPAASTKSPQDSTHAKSQDARDEDGLAEDDEQTDEPRQPMSFPGARPIASAPSSSKSGGQRSDKPKPRPPIHAEKGAIWKVSKPDWCKLFSYVLEHNMNTRKPKKIFTCLPSLQIPVKGSEKAFRVKWKLQRQKLETFALAYNELKTSDSTIGSTPLSYPGLLKHPEMKRFLNMFSPDPVIALKLGLLAVAPRDRRNIHNGRGEPSESSSEASGGNDAYESDDDDHSVGQKHGRIQQQQILQIQQQQQRRPIIVNNNRYNPTISVFSGNNNMSSSPLAKGSFLASSASLAAAQTSSSFPYQHPSQASMTTPATTPSFKSLFESSHQQQSKLSAKNVTKEDAKESSASALIGLSQSRSPSAVTKIPATATTTSKRTKSDPSSASSSARNSPAPTISLKEPDNVSSRKIDELSANLLRTNDRLNSMEHNLTRISVVEKRLKTMEGEMQRIASIESKLDMMLNQLMNQRT